MLNTKLLKIRITKIKIVTTTRIYSTIVA